MLACSKSLSRSRKERAFGRIFFCTVRNEMLQASLCSSGWNIVLHRESVGKSGFVLW